MNSLMDLQKSAIVLEHMSVYHDVNKPLPVLLASVMSSARLTGTVIPGGSAQGRLVRPRRKLRTYLCSLREPELWLGMTVEVAEAI